MNEFNWVTGAQCGLLIIGIFFWFVPEKKGGGGLKLSLWNSSWWEGLLFLVLAIAVVALGLPGGFLLPCIFFFLFKQIETSRYLTYLNNRELSWSEIIGIAVRSFLKHWPILLVIYWGCRILLPDSPAQENVVLLREGPYEIRVQIVFLALIIAPLTEELFFRGILYRTLKSSIDTGPAIVVTSFAFAFAHWNAVAFGPLFALSAFLILVYERSGHLAVPIIYHACFNMVMVLSIIFGNSGK